MSRFFDFLKMAASAILDFLHLQFLLACEIWKAELHQCAKFYQNRSIRSGDITIFQLFKMSAAAIVDFRNSQISLADGLWEAKCITVLNFVKIGQTVFGISRFFDYSIWRLPPSWISEILKFY